VLDFDADLYGEHMAFAFSDRLRARCASTASTRFVAQMQRDVDEVRKTLL